MNNLKIGQVVYHRTNITKCIIVDILENDLCIKLSRPICDKEYLILPKSHIGEWLFYEESHINLEINKLACKKEYSFGKRIIEYVENVKLEDRRRKEQRHHTEFIERQSIFKEIATTKTVEEILSERRILYLTHFTTIENLEGILSNGFVPRITLDKQNVEYISNDLYRSDDKKNCTCFSVEFPNIRLLNSFKNNQNSSGFEEFFGVNIQKHSNIWVVLIIDAKVLVEHKGEKFYCYYNAASNDIKSKLKAGQLNSSCDFENMFKDRVECKRYNGSFYATRRGLTSFLPTSDQAEILIEGIISKEFIKGVCFQNEDVHNRFIETIKDKKLINGVNIFVEPRCFEVRGTYPLNDRSNMDG